MNVPASNREVPSWTGLYSEIRCLRRLLKPRQGYQSLASLPLSVALTRPTMSVLPGILTLIHPDPHRQPGRPAHRASFRPLAR